MGARSYYVYILANRIGGTLYIGVTKDLNIGVTKDLIRRVYEHKSGTLRASPNVTTSIDWFISSALTILKRPFIVRRGSRSGRGPGKLR
jgi:hypothetical protein